MMTAWRHPAPVLERMGVAVGQLRRVPLRQIHVPARRRRTQNQARDGFGQNKVKALRFLRLFAAMPFQ